MTVPIDAGRRDRKSIQIGRLVSARIVQSFDEMPRRAAGPNSRGVTRAQKRSNSGWKITDNERQRCAWFRCYNSRSRCVNFRENIGEKKKKKCDRSRFRLWTERERWRKFRWFAAWSGFNATDYFKKVRPRRDSASLVMTVYRVGQRSLPTKVNS